MSLGPAGSQWWGDKRIYQEIEMKIVSENSQFIKEIKHMGLIAFGRVYENSWGSYLLRFTHPGLGRTFYAF